MNKYLSLFLWIIVYLGVGFGIGQITQGAIDGWYADLQKPSFNPPNWIFPIAWSFLYVLIATAGWNLWRKGAGKTLKALFILYTVLNWAWTPIFFGMEQMLVAFVWIWVLNVVNLAFIIKAWRPVRLSSSLMILPLFWTLFASVLNYAVWMLNS